MAKVTDVTQIGHGKHQTICNTKCGNADNARNNRHDYQERRAICGIANKKRISAACPGPIRTRMQRSFSAFIILEHILFCKREFGFPWEFDYVH